MSKEYILASLGSVRDNTQDGGPGEFWKGRATQSLKEIRPEELYGRSLPTNEWVECTAVWLPVEHTAPSRMSTTSAATASAVVEQ